MIYLKTIIDSDPDIDISVKRPPSVNATHKKGKNGNVYRSKEYELWRSESWVDWLTGKRRFKINLPITCQIMAVFNIGGTGVDVDNMGKALCDYLQMVGIIKDDKQIVCLVQQRSDKLEKVVDIEIYLLTEKHCAGIKEV